MTLIAYVLSALIAFSGIFAGVFLARSAKEEMPTASKYFPWMQKLIFLAVVFLVLDFFKVHLVLIALLIAIVAAVLLKYELQHRYTVLAFFLFLLGQQNQSLFVISALIFLYGFPEGSLLVYKKRFSRKDVVVRILKKYWSFLAVAVGLQLLYSVFVLGSF